MKSYMIRKDMFINWSDEDLKLAIDVICVKFGLSVQMTRKEHLVDWNKTDKPDIWSFMFLAHETDDYKTTVMVKYDEQRYVSVRAFCQHYGHGLDYEGDKHEMMRSLLAIICGSTLFVEPKIHDRGHIYLPKPASVSGALAHNSTTYKVTASLMDENIMMPQNVKVPICTIPEFSSVEELKLKLEIVK